MKLEPVHHHAERVYDGDAYDDAGEHSKPDHLRTIRGTEETRRPVAHRIATTIMTAMNAAPKIARGVRLPPHAAWRSARAIRVV